TPEQRETLLARYKAAHGSAYSIALGAAIPKLPAAERTKARSALKAQLTRLSAKELRECLADPEVELHRAAALVCADKGSREFVPDLIQCLKDADRSIARAAHLALIRTTGQNFGPEANAAPEGYAAAAERWAEWWQQKTQ